MSERRRSITVEARTAAWLIDRDGFVLAQSPMARRLLGDLSGLEGRAVLAARDPGGISVRMLGWCLALGERHAAMFGGRTLVMQPLGAGVLVTFGRSAPASQSVELRVERPASDRAPARITLMLPAAA